MTLGVKMNDNFYQPDLDYSSEPLDPLVDPAEEWDSFNEDD